MWPSRPVPTLEDELYSERFLIKRPLLAAIGYGDGPPPVLLIDEIDRADDEFEALLLEVLSEHAVTVPELGRFSAEIPPVVVITSNRTRDVHDALKRRCLYHWVEHPDFEREVEIVRRKAPEAGERLARQVAAAVAGLRQLGMYKPPGVAESIDWARALARLGCTDLDDGVRGGEPRHRPEVPGGPATGEGARRRGTHRRGHRTRRLSRSGGTRP